MEETTTLKAARAYTARGLAVFPVNGKIPATPNGFKDASLDDAQLEEWFGGPARNIAIAIPRGIVVVDIDPRNNGMETFAEWCAIGPGLAEAFDAAPLAYTGGGGSHSWFRYDGRPLVKAIHGIDFQRIGKYVVAPPSKTDASYKWARTLPANLDDLPELPEWLLELATLQTKPAESFPVEHRFHDGNDPLAAAVERYATFEQLLARHGWVQVGADKWRHPATQNDFSATIRHGCLFVYSPNTPFEVTEPGAPHGYTLWSAVELLDFHGDRKAMVGALVQAGYLAERERPGSLDFLAAAQAHTFAPDTLEEMLAEDDEDGLIPLGVEIDWPALKRKEDDTEQRWLCEPLIARGRAHALYAPAKVGKSMLMLAAAAAIATGRPFLEMPAGEPQSVVYCDYEMTDDDVATRLEGFGYDLDDPLLANLHYFLLGSGDGLDTPDGGATLVKSAYMLGAVVVIVDTTSRAVAGAENDADTFRAFYRHTGARLKRLGMAVTRLDHAGKEAEKGQRGSSAKNDDVDVVQRLTKTGTDEKAHRDYFMLEATHHRMGWVPNNVKLVLGEDDGTSSWERRESIVYPKGTKEAAEILDALDAPLKLSARAAKKALRANGWKGPNDVAEGAIKWRQEIANGGILAELEGRSENLGTPVGTLVDDPFSGQLRDASGQ